MSCSINKKNIMPINSLSFHTEYNQFYIKDKKCTANTNSSKFWTDKAFSERLALEYGIIGIRTQSYGNIKGEIIILDRSTNILENGLFNHIVEGGIDINSGELQILNCPDNQIQLELKVIPGKYRVRIYSSNLSSVKETDLAHDTDNDYYRIEIWPSEEMETRVLKQYLE